jgi:hypothetical protein
VLFDKGAEGPARDLADWVGAKIASLPIGIDDPGDLLNNDLLEMADKNYDGYSYLTQSAQTLYRQIVQGNALLKKLSNKP